MSQYTIYVTFFKELPLNALLKDTQLSSVVGKDTVLKFLQPVHVDARLVIDVAFNGNVISNKFLQALNALNNEVRELADVGNITLYKLIQF